LKNASLKCFKIELGYFLSAFILKIKISNITHITAGLRLRGKPASVEFLEKKDWSRLKFLSRKICLLEIPHTKEISIGDPLIDQNEKV